MGTNAPRNRNELFVMHLLGFIFLLTYCSADTPEVCYPSVVRHRIDSIFPTSRLFCVSKQNDDLEYGDVEIVNGEEQWNEFSKSRWQQDESDSQENLELLHFGSSRAVRLFKFPAAISASDFCTGTQNVITKRNMTVKCKPLATTDILSHCSENEFLNAQALFGNGDFVERTENETIAIPRLSTAQFIAPVWNNSMCYGVLKSANIIFRMNGIKTNSVEIDAQYDSLPGNVDNNWFEQTFSVYWIPLVVASEIETNQTVVGYKAGEQTYRVKGSIPVPFAVPTLGNCYSGSIAPSPVFFLRSMSSVCTISTINCEDARAKARAFYEQVYPSVLVSSPSEDAHPASVGRVNVTWEELSPSTISCRLPVSSLLQIYYSKQGSTKNYREVIIAGNSQLLLDDVPYLSGQEIRMPISISFTEVTPPPKNIFSALPYVDIRLPHDFFYPFMSTSNYSASLNYSQCIFIIFIIYILK